MTLTSFSCARLVPLATVAALALLLSGCGDRAAGIPAAAASAPAPGPR
mgnify:CR=1 FL=1